MHRPWNFFIFITVLICCNNLFKSIFNYFRCITQWGISLPWKSLIYFLLYYLLRKYTAKSVRKVWSREIKLTPSWKKIGERLIPSTIPSKCRWPLRPIQTQARSQIALKCALKCSRKTYVFWSDKNAIKILNFERSERISVFLSAQLILRVTINQGCIYSRR